MAQRVAAEHPALLDSHGLFTALRHGVGLVDPSSDWVPDDGAKLDLLGEVVGGRVTERFEEAKAAVREALASLWPSFVTGT
jgi:hypothetical protein